MSDSSSDAVLVLVCGLPAAGKTTLVKHLVARCNTTSRSYEWITFDDLYVQQMSDNGDSRPTEFDPETWKACQQGMVLRVSKCLKEYTSARSSGSTHQRVLLVDDNFQYRSLRKRFFHLATEVNCGFGLLYVNTPVAICRERNAGRDDHARVPDEVFERMVTVFEAPNGCQSSWEVKEMVDVSNIGEVMNALIQQAHYERNERSLAQMDAQREAAQQHRDRLSTQQSVLHLVDLQLRRWISTQHTNEAFVWHYCRPRACTRRVYRGGGGFARISTSASRITVSKRYDDIHSIWNPYKASDLSILAIATSGNCTAWRLGSTAWKNERVLLRIQKRRDSAADYWCSKCQTCASRQT